MSTLTVRPQAQAMTLIDFKNLADVIDAASGAIGKIADSVAHLISLGDKAWSVVSARQAYASLNSVDARLTNLVQTDQSALVENIRHYIELWGRMTQADESQRARLRNDLKAAWPRVIDNIRQVLAMTKNLLVEVKADLSDFVTESARGTLLGALQAKVGLLDRLQFIETMPESAEEISELTKLSEKFEMLRMKTIEAIEAMSAYIKKIEG
jgi:hypothetical protein